MLHLMCGRYTLKRKDLEAMLRKLGVPLPAAYESRYNIAPATAVPAVREKTAGAREAATLKWGLVPSWAKTSADGARLANARAEGIAEKPSFRDALQRRRCVVPASGFYEWQTIGRLKQPWYFTLRDEEPFVFAGLWETWRSADGVTLETCALITTAPNEIMTPVHDRMPVILRGADVDTWLARDVMNAAQLTPLLRPLPGEVMTAWPVSPAVNSSRTEGPECIVPAAPLQPEDPPQLSLGLE